MLDRSFRDPLAAEQALVALAVLAAQSTTGRMPETDADLAAALRCVPDVALVLAGLAAQAGIPAPNGVRIALTATDA